MTPTIPETMPNFFIIGATKAGTTSLYHYLQQHPDIFLGSPKEMVFFASDYEGTRIVRFPNRPKNLTEYQQIFAEARHKPARGEVSTPYLFLPTSARRIAEHVPDAKLIVMLRHPAERAFSQYQHMRRDGYETVTDFGEALALEPERLATDPWVGWQYRPLGYYAAQIAHYQQYFARSQLRVYLYDDFARDTNAVLRDIFSFLEVDPDVRIDHDVRHNISGIPRNRALHQLVNRNKKLRQNLKRVLPHWLTKRLAHGFNRRNLVRETLPNSLYNALTEEYRDDILALEKLIDRDLSGWLEPRPEPQ